MEEKDKTENYTKYILKRWKNKFLVQMKKLY